MRLDKKDRKILYQLDLNARQSISSIAKKVGLSKQSVSYKMGRLEKSNIINGYYTIIDSSTLGYTTFRIYIKFRNIDPEAKETMISYINQQKTIFAVASLSGQWDLVFLFNVENNLDFYKYWENILEKFLEFIHDYKIAIYSPIYHYSKAYLINEKDSSSVRILGQGKKLSIDRFDKHILSIIAEHARINLIAISQSIKLTPEAISYRIKKLEHLGIILGYRALIDINKLGVKHYKVDYRLRSFKHFKSILEYGHMNPYIYQINKTIGGETLEIEFQVENLERLHEELDKLEKQFPNTFEKYDYYVRFKELKVKYMPDI